MPRLLTLTVDRKRFKGPEEAWGYVTDHRLVPRLMGALGVRWWYAGLEFQMQSGDGWPHWHVMIDMDGAKGRIDLKRAWYLWRDKWGVGGLDLGKQRDAQDALTAVRYVTKYVVKSLEALDASRLVELAELLEGFRRIRTYGAFLGIPKEERWVA